MFARILKTELFLLFLFFSLYGKPQSQNLDFDTISFSSSFVYNPKSDICTEDPVTLINRSANSDSITYTWFMPGGSPSQYTGYHPPLVNYSSAGQYTITLSIQGPAGCSESYSKTIDVVESCCDHDYHKKASSSFNEILGSRNKTTTYSGGGVFDGTYLVEGSIILSDGIYTVMDGTTFYVEPQCEECDGISQMEEACHIFTEDRTQIILREGAVLEIGDAEFRSVCDEMWYGIIAYQGSQILVNENPDIENALFMDALSAITICNMQDPNYYYINQAAFVNNIFGVHEVGHLENPVNDQVRNSIFDSKSPLLKEPYTNHISHTAIVMESQHHALNYEFNDIRNTLHGIYHTGVQNPNVTQKINDNRFSNFQVTAIATGGGKGYTSQFNDNVLIFPENPIGSAQMPISDYGTYTGSVQIYPASAIFPGGVYDLSSIHGMLLSGVIEVNNNHFKGAILNEDYTQKQIGLASRTVYDHHGIITGDYFDGNRLSDLYVGYMHYTADNVTGSSSQAGLDMGMINNDFIRNKTALVVNHPSYGPLNILNNRFIENELAIRTNYFEFEYIVKDNLFLDNDTSLSVLHDNDNLPLDLTMNCNKFQLDNIEIYDRYGLFVHQGADMGDIGGNNPAANLNPAGNNWPIDSIATVNQGIGALPPYLTTPNAAGIDVSVFKAPLHWYAIYDANPNPNWTYWRYNNEFVGETDGAVQGNNVVQPAFDPLNEPINASHNGNGCIGNLNIIFPQARKGRVVAKEMSNLKVYPVPTDGKLRAEHPNRKIVTLKVKTPKGRDLPLHINKIPYGIEIDLNDKAAGIYILEVVFENGEKEYVQIIKS